MKRDMDLVRAILLDLETDEDIWWLWQYLAHDEKPDRFKIEGYPDKLVSYHVKIMQEGGLLVAGEAGYLGQPEWWVPIRLTWEGHEFLDAAKDEARWKKVMELVKKEAVAVPFGVLAELLKALAKEAVGLN